METKLDSYHLSVILPMITVIGKEGLCTTEKNIVQELWQEANSHFNEVAALGMKNSDGWPPAAAPWS